MSVLTAAGASVNGTFDIGTAVLGCVTGRICGCLVEKVMDGDLVSDCVIGSVCGGSVGAIVKNF